MLADMDAWRTWRIQQGLRLIQLEQVRIVKGCLYNGAQLLKDGHPVYRTTLERTPPLYTDFLSEPGRPFHSMPARSCCMQRMLPFLE